MTQVSISGNNHTVNIEHDGADLIYVIEKAQQLWDDTRPPERSPGSNWPVNVVVPLRMDRADLVTFDLVTFFSHDEWQPPLDWREQI